MPEEYSLYEAKARLSALVRQVREGHTIVITVHGVPAAELRPIDPERKPQSLDERLAELRALGLIQPAAMKPSDPATFAPVAHRPGALQQFLEERD
ncbi:MAG: type II toxin-antitoxin system prevent-host-death family antitoxin [Gemmatimonadetes bacterium]|nr:type II toxin-antitoxin system prevent-host-death family antitoxin [Gemmatimonadota bacterium]